MTSARLASLSLGWLALLWSAAALAQTFEPLTIAGASGRHAFQVEVARNDAERVGERITQAFGFATSVAPH